VPTITTHTTTQVVFSGNMETIVVAEDASIVPTTGDGVFDDTWFYVTLLNRGTIASGRNGVEFTGSSNRVINLASGVISGFEIGVNATNNAFDFEPYLSIQNDGLITGWNTGVAAGRLSLVNGGDITSNASAVRTEIGHITNSGDIIGNVKGIHTTLSLDLINTGTISGLEGSIHVEYGPASIENAGVLLGDVYLPSSAGSGSYLCNTGSIVGNVFLSGGQDIYEGRLGRISGSVSGAAGNDRLVSGFDDDTLKGDAGSDTLAGGAGDDTLVGGVGADRLKGGVGEDTFVFAGGDSRSNSPDVIRQWEEHDFLDVSQIDAFSAAGKQDMEFVGALTGPTNLNQGEIGYYQSGGNTIVVAECTGDGKADLVIRLTGLHTLSLEDFILA
jgi:Ca2+-binding RTX toxin-like protein